ncbi:MAG: N-acetyl-gamma-glutamyl-phosphate reductase [Longimicrobiales bacterium]
MNKTATGAAGAQTGQAEKDRARAVVLGGTGYTGQELIRLLRHHPQVELVGASSESEAGARVAGTSLRYAPAAGIELGQADLVFCCLPHGESGHWARRSELAGAIAIDLSSDLRAPGAGAVYGLPELWRAEIREARLIANPGCYPTGVLLGLAPAVTRELIDESRPIVIDAASGVTGAGRTAKRDLLFGEVAEDYRAYGVGNVHRHVPEMRVGLGRLAESAPSFVFTPHLLPVKRGILETMYLPLRNRMTTTEAASLWAEFYAGEAFVEVMGGDLPSLSQVAGRNVVSIGFAEVEDLDAPMLIVVAALDNLVKGAAGQAIQNANLALGIPETLGLPA